MFITFEGPEGGGKSTQIATLAAFLTERGFQVRRTREPGGTPIGEQIRTVLHAVDNTAMVPAAEILLYSASRAQLIDELVRPSLAAGEIVLCDRFSDSTLAYQGYGRGLPLDELKRITAFATGGLTPDLTLLLDIDIRAGLARRRDGELRLNRLDLESIAFHERVRAGYHALMREEPARWVKVDAEADPTTVQQAIRQAVMAALRRRPTSLLT